MAGKRFLLFVVMFLLAGSGVAAAIEPPQAGQTFPAMKLIKPSDKTDLKYLGLSGSGEFSVNQIKARAVIVQVFSMYCPYCQKDAPNINRLFGLIENNPELKGKIKILGIGAGNTVFEVKTFKKKYAVEFPLIPDGDYKAHKILGEVRTPYFIVVKMSDAGNPEVVYSKLGAHADIEAFLADVIKLAGVQ